MSRRVTHTQSIPSPFFIFTYILPFQCYYFFYTSQSRPFYHLIPFSFRPFSYILSAVKSMKCILLRVHLCLCTLDVMVCPVLAVHSDLFTPLCLDATWTHTDRWGNSREIGVVRDLENRRYGFENVKDIEKVQYHSYCICSILMTVHLPLSHTPCGHNTSLLIQEVSGEAVYAAQTKTFYISRKQYQVSRAQYVWMCHSSPQTHLSEESKRSAV